MESVDCISIFIKAYFSSLRMIERTSPKLDTCQLNRILDNSLIAAACILQCQKRN